MIEIQSLTKVYPNGKGIFDVSFCVSPGEVFGFLGPNGAGKTTTIRCLMGFTNPSSGECRIGGLDCRTESAQIQQRLGYVPGEIAFFENMTGMGFLTFMAQMRGLKETKRRDDLIKRFELESERKIRRMSKGMKQKVGLIAAFMHDPEIIILDEPTSGLDPLMQRRFIELIQEEKTRGKTILMSSHLFDEVDRTCERVAIIRQGRIVAVEEIAALKATLRRSYLVTVADAKGLERIKASGLEYRILGENRVEINVSNNYAQMLSTLAGSEVVGLDVSAQSLEQIFIRYYGEEAN